MFYATRPQTRPHTSTTNDHADQPPKIPRASRDNRGMVNRGDRVRIRRAGYSDDWCTATVALDSGASVLLMLDDGVRTADGGVILGALPLTVDYVLRTLRGLDGCMYEIEIQASTATCPRCGGVDIYAIERPDGTRRQPIPGDPLICQGCWELMTVDIDGVPCAWKPSQLIAMAQVYGLPLDQLRDAARRGRARDAAQ